jgi:hypothetical protein
VATAPRQAERAELQRCIAAEHARAEEAAAAVAEEAQRAKAAAAAAAARQRAAAQRAAPAGAAASSAQDAPGAPAAQPAGGTGKAAARAGPAKPAQPAAPADEAADRRARDKEKEDAAKRCAQRPRCFACCLRSVGPSCFSRFSARMRRHYSADAFSRLSAGWLRARLSRKVVLQALQAVRMQQVVPTSLRLQRLARRGSSCRWRRASARLPRAPRRSRRRLLLRAA